MMNALLVALLGCSPDSAPPADPAPPACGIDGTPEWEDPTVFPKDDLLTLAHLQARGTHNSYHLAPDVLLDETHAYSHAPISEQLGALGVRQLELDLHLRDDGAFDVFHLPGIDPETTCLSLADCLAEICVWSASNPDHVPALIWMEPKDDLDAFVEGYQPFAGATAALEDEILAFFPRERIYAPDDWKRGEADLGAATAALGPPVFGDVRGKVLFALLDSSEHRATYLAERPDLTGRLLFPDTDGPADTFAALVKDASAAEMPALLAAGLVVTDHVDGPELSEAESTASRDALLDAGIQYASTDFPAPSDGYWLELPDADPIRCNPATAPADCSPGDLE